MPPKGTIAPQQAYLGGLTCGDSYEKEKSIYGQPKKIAGNNGYDTYHYSNSFSVEFNDSKIWRITTKDNNGIATPDGVTVGQKPSVLIDIYGDPTWYQSTEKGFNGIATYNYHGCGAAEYKEFFFYV